MAKEKNQELEVGVKREKDQRNGIRKKIKKETEVEIGTKKMKRIRTEENRYCLCTFLLIQNDYTVPGKSKLTVPRYSNASTRSSILETRKLRVSSLKSRTSSFESRILSFKSRISSFKSRTLSFKMRIKELSA